MKIVIILFMCFILCGCENKERYKEQYINYKKQLYSSNIFTKEDKLPFDIHIDIKKEKELMKYNIVINNQKEVLNDVQVLVVHNQITNDIYPSVGIFNEKKSLVDENSKIELSGYFETTNDVEELVVSFKFIIKFIDVEGNNKVIYYKTTK